jgi:hypothetical protein
MGRVLGCRMADKIRVREVKFPAWTCEHAEPHFPAQPGDLTLCRECLILFATNGGDTVDELANSVSLAGFKGVLHIRLWPDKKQSE